MCFSRASGDDLLPGDANSLAVCGLADGGKSCAEVAVL